MAIARLATGTLLKVGDGNISEGFTLVPGVMRLRGPAVRFDLLDTSDHDSGVFREYIPGFADGDVISGELNWRPSNTIHKSIRIDAYNQTLRDFRLVFPDISDNTVTAATYVQNWEPRADAGRQMLNDFGLKVTGSPTWT